MPNPAIPLRRAMQIAAVLVVAVAMSALTFYVIDLAFDLFPAVIGYVLNCAIIAGFGFICWKMRFVLYDNLHFLH